MDKCREAFEAAMRSIGYTVQEADDRGLELTWGLAWRASREQADARLKAAEELSIAAGQASFCLRELLPNDPDAKFTVDMLGAALKAWDEAK